MPGRDVLADFGDPFKQFHSEDPAEDPLDSALYHFSLLHIPQDSGYVDCKGRDCRKVSPVFSPPFFPSNLGHPLLTGLSAGSLSEVSFPLGK